MASEPISGVATRYRKRHIKFLRLHLEAAFAIKVYSITRDPAPVSFVDKAVHAAMKYLRTPIHSVPAAGIEWSRIHSHGVGSLIVHEGREAVFALLDVWVDDNMLRHQAYLADVLNAHV